MKRSAGVLMHISSLPGEFGIGMLGENARKFADLLKESGFTYWQILPVNEPDEYNSPYKSPSAFAGNRFLIDLSELHKQGLLLTEELDQEKQQNPYLCEFARINETRSSILKKAFSRIDETIKCEVEIFKGENPWLTEYANFMALKTANNNAPWQEWDILTPPEDEAEFHCYIQYEFFRQWACLKTYTDKIGIKIIGDMPLYVSADSADVYANSKMFLLDKKGVSLCEAGVPPDYFSADGQAWGNPLYNWKAMKRDGYKWWINRIEYSLMMFDKVRIDHFRGFSEYWAIPKGKKPVKGKWEPGPGIDFFKKLANKIPNPNIIAEDLGDIDQKVIDLLEATAFPGMKVAQFGFIGKDDNNNPHLPHNYINNSVAYTGTHDNNTLLGWLWELPPENREYVLKYCGFNFNGENWGEGGANSPVIRSIIKTVYQSNAGIVILPIQDLCGFGGDTRMNTPGRSDGNWAFRITEEQLSSIDKTWFLEMNKLYGRK